MVTSYNINAIDISVNTKFESDLIKKSFGLGQNHINCLSSRFEYFNELSNFNQNLNLYKTIVTNLLFLFPLNSLFLNQKNSYIFFLDLSYSYKGWRHLNGLPCNGQRTWSNAWSSYKSNLWLKSYKFQLAKNYYGKLGGPEHKVAALSEYINYMWKIQWHSEWFLCRGYIKKVLLKTVRSLNIDLTATSKYYIGNLQKSSKTSKKKKKLLTGVVGFDHGFTKLYFKLKYETSKSTIKHWRKKKIKT